MRSHVSADAIDFPQSLANLRQRPSQAKVRSTTTQQRGRTLKPLALRSIAIRFVICKSICPVRSNFHTNLVNPGTQADRDG